MKAKNMNGAVAPQSSLQEEMMNRAAQWLDARHEFFQFEKKPTTTQFLHFCHIMLALFTLVSVADQSLFGAVAAFVWMIFAFSICKK